MYSYYFIDIQLEENEEDLELQEFTDYGLDGSWIIHCDDYKIIHDNKDYNKVMYDNTTKLISFFENDKLMVQYKLVLEKKTIST